MSDPKTIDPIVRSLSSEQVGEYYRREVICGNCGEQNVAYIAKGFGVEGKRIICSNCGCSISMKSYRELFK